MFKATCLTPTLEDGLKVISIELRQGGPVTTSRIAKLLHISDPSVSVLFRRLEDAGLVRYTRYKGVVLTEPGTKYAAALLARNQLVRRFLASALAFSGDMLVAESDVIEHAISPSLEAHLTAYLLEHESSLDETA